MRVGRYQIVGKLATGGMAEVYLARHGEISGFQTLVVVKRILPHLGSDQQFIEMFLDEARIAARLDHPNVVRIVEVGRAGTEYFLAMDLVQGESLAEIMRRGVKDKRPLTHQLAALVVAHAAAGLHHAHTLCDVTGKELSVVHRDVSPQNILVSFEGAVKVIDFGVARALGRVTSTHTGGVKGKFGYMSPEQARGEVVDARSDIFALGVVLWETICSRRLFKRETDLATLRAIVDEPVPKPSDHVQVSPALEQIVMRALERDREHRYASAHDMQQALEGWIYGEARVSGADLARYLKELMVDRLAKWRDAIRMALEKGDAPPEIAGQPLLGTPSSAGANSLPARTGSSRVGQGLSGARRTPSLPGTPPLPPGVEAAASGDDIEELAADDLHTVYGPAGDQSDTTPVDPPSVLEAEGALRKRRIKMGAAIGGGAALLLAVVIAVASGGEAADGEAVAVPTAAPMIPSLENPPAPVVPPGTGVAPATGTAAPAPERSAQAVATLFVSTEPKGARILVDGVVKAESTPSVLKLAPGDTKLRLEKDGYEAKTLEVTLYADQEKVIEERLTRTRVAPEPRVVGRPAEKPAASPAAVTPPPPEEKPVKKPVDFKPNPFE